MDVIGNLLIEHPALSTLCFGMLIPWGKLKAKNKSELLGEFIGRTAVLALVFYTIAKAHR